MFTILMFLIWVFFFAAAFVVILNIAEDKLDKYNEED